MTQRQITTIDELRHLKDTSIIRDFAGFGWEYDHLSGYFSGTGMSGLYPPTHVALPAVILWEPAQ